MKIDASILLIHSYSTISIKVDKHINLDDLSGIAGLQGHVLFAPKFFILKKEKPLEDNENRVFFAVKLPEKKEALVPEV